MRAPARRGNEKTHVGVGGAGCAGGSGHCRRGHAWRLVVGGRRRPGAAPECAPPGSGRDRDCRQEDHSGPHRSARQRHSDRQRRDQDPHRFRDRGRAFSRRRDGAQGRSLVHARQPRARCADQAELGAARGREGKSRSGRARCRALYRASRQERHHPGHAQQRANAGQHLASRGRFQYRATGESRRSSSATARSAPRSRAAPAWPR